MSGWSSAPCGLRALYGAGVCGALAGLLVGGWSSTVPARSAFPSPSPSLRGALLQPAPALRPRTDGGLALSDLPGLLTGGFARRWTAAAAPGELECLTQAVYYEARGEPASGQAAVAQVVLNRTRTEGFPRRVCAVVFQHKAGGCQFSFTCDGAMRRPRDPAAWARARAVAVRALDGGAAREVGGATYFRVAAFEPRWGALMRVARIGAHAFYGLSPPAAAVKSPT